MLILGDCFDEILKIKSKTVDLIIIDPPYLISRDSNFKKYSKTTSKEMQTKYNISIDFGQWDKSDLDWGFLFSNFWRLWKSGGTIIIFYDIWKSTEIAQIAQNVGFKQPRVCCWQKTNPVPINSKINYLSNAAEYFFSFVKGKKPTFNSEYDNGYYRYPICHGRERLAHPTQKPIGLIKELIEKHSNPGDLVFDCFAGTGTVGEACIELGRDYMLIEKDENYYKMIQQRLNKFDKQWYKNKKNMPIIIKNSQLSNDTIEALNTIIDLDINASSAFRLTRIIKELTSIVDDKLKMEKRILEKWVERDENGDPVQAKDASGNIIEGAVNISDVEAFTQEMSQLLEIENEIPFERMDFEELNLQTAKVKDLIKLDFLFN